MTSIDTGGASTPNFSETASTFSVASVFAAAAASSTLADAFASAASVVSSTFSAKQWEIEVRSLFPHRYPTCVRVCRYALSGVPF